MEVFPGNICREQACEENFTVRGFEIIYGLHVLCRPALAVLLVVTLDKRGQSPFLLGDTRVAGHYK